MKKITSILSLLAFLLIVSCGISFCQEADLSGTWEGTTEVPEEAELDQVTLVLEKINGEYSGTFTDSLGFAEDAELKDIEFKDNTLTFNFTIFNGFEYMTVYATLTVEENKMSGHWETEDGNSSTIELERKD
ncbi:MAG: hypothetical protein E3J44_03355 [Candidatus Aminicenantes bacterium]|nr:MAG: hypothetical protein E3J44_03355 [Candidatus Aminicenantes bacterium]